MSLQEPHEHFEREMEDSNEEENLHESPLSDSEQESESVTVPENEVEAVSLPAKEKPPPPEDETITSEAPEGPAWYVIHCYSGYENKVRHNLEQRIETMGMKDRIFDVVIPTQEEIEVKDGKRRTVERHIFPGTIAVKYRLPGQSDWYPVEYCMDSTWSTITQPLPVDDASQHAYKVFIGDYHTVGFFLTNGGLRY